MFQYRRIFKEVFANVVIFLFLFNIIWVLAVTHTPSNGFEFLVFALPFALMYVVRKFTRNGSSFVLFTALICAVSVAVLAQITIFTFIFIFLMAAVLYHVYAWMNSDYEPGFTSGAWAFVAHLILMFLITTNISEPSAYQARLVFVFLVAAGFMIIHKQMDSIDIRMLSYRASGKYFRTTRELIAKNTALVIAFAGFVIIFGFFAMYFPGHLILRFYDWLLSFLPYDDTPQWFGEPQEDIEAEFGLLVGELSAHGTDYDMPEVQDVHPFYRILLWLGAFALGILGMYVLYKIAMFFIGVTRELIRHKKKIEYLDNDEEKISLEGSFFSDMLDILPKFGKIRHPLRRAYAKKVNNHIRQGVLIENYDCTDRIADKIRNAENIDELTENYEKIRYGRQD